jgi:hypothetical protein
VTLLVALFVVGVILMATGFLVEQNERQPTH